MRQVLPWGNSAARYVLLGECPGQLEEETGEPFVGASGFRLKEWWARAGLKREDFYILNVIEFRPPHNNLDAFETGYIQQWMSYTHQRIAALTDPWIIIPTGNIALYALTGKGKVKWHTHDGKQTRAGITDWRGSILEYTDLNGRKIKVVPTIHPAATFRQPDYEGVCIRDWIKIAYEGTFKETRLPQRVHATKPTLLEVDAYLGGLRAGSVVAVDIENPKPKEPLNEKVVAPIVCIGFSDRADYSLTVPTTKSYWGSEQVVEQVWYKIKGILENHSIEKVFHNGCIPAEASVLTPSGWVSIRDFNGTKQLAAQWSMDGSVIFAPARLVESPTNLPVLEVQTRDHRCTYTTNHRIVHKVYGSQKWRVLPAAQVSKLDRVCLPTAGVLNNKGARCSMYLKLLVAMQADAHLSGNRAVFNLKKPRKIERLFALCAEYGMRIKQLKRSYAGESSFSVFGPASRTATALFKANDKRWGAWILQLPLEDRLIILNELGYWDGSMRGRGCVYFSKHPENLEWVAALAAISGWSARLKSEKSISLIPTYTTTVQKYHWTSGQSIEPMYCLETVTGMFIARLRGRTFVTGNSYDTFHLAWERNIKVIPYRFDTLYQHHCLDPSDWHSLDYCASRDSREPYWKHEAKDAEEAAKYASNLEAFWVYNGKDVAVCRELHDVYYNRLIEQGRLDFYLKHYAALLEPLQSLQLHGVKVDDSKRKRRLAHLMADCLELQDQLEEKTGLKLYGKSSLSNTKLKHYLYEVLGLPKQERTRKERGDKTVTADELAVRRLMLKHPKQLGETGPLILTNKRKSKLQEFYADGRADSDGRFRSSYSLNTEAGRLSSKTNPNGTGSNAQQIDREARDMFIPDDDCVMVEVDLSAAEARINYIITYMLTGNKEMFDKARVRPDEYDQHVESASFIFNVAMDQVTKEQRQLSKATVHGSWRDMQGQKLSDQLLKDGYIRTAKECQHDINEYRKRITGIDEYFRWCRRQVIEHRFVENSWGRRLYFTYDRFSDELYRRAYSFFPQSDIGDHMNVLGLVPFFWYIQDASQREGQVVGAINVHAHDALVFSVKPQYAYDLTNFLVKSLEQERVVYKPTLIIPCSIKIGTNWRGAHEFKRMPPKQEFIDAVHSLQH